MKLDHWDSGREEIRNIPVVCGACGQKVSVGGQIQDGVMVFDPCPNCGVVITGGLYLDSEETVEEDRNLEIGAEVDWCIDGGVEFRRSNSFGPMTNVPSLLLAVLMSGANYFSQPNLSMDYLYMSVACMLAGNVLSEVGVDKVLEVCQGRLMECKKQAGPKVIKLNGNNGKVSKPGDKTQEDEDHDE